MGYYPDIPVSLHGWELKGVEHVKNIGSDYYKVTYRREDRWRNNVDVEIKLEAGILGWIAESIPSVLRPVDDPSDAKKAPELLTEDENDG